MKRRAEEQEDSIISPSKYHQESDDIILSEKQIQIKRKDGMDDIDFSPLKRRRCVGIAQQHNDIDPIIIRIVGWLREQHIRDNLPKTFPKLSKAISPLCRAVVQVDSTVVFYHLVFNHIILLEEDNMGTITYIPNPAPIRHSFVGFVPEDSPSIPFSDEFVAALEKSTAWVLSNRGLKYFQNPEEILLQLHQICKLKKEIDPDVVVELLMMRGIVSFCRYYYFLFLHFIITIYDCVNICRDNESDDVCYDSDGLVPSSLLSPALSHYAPIVIQ